MEVALCSNYLIDDLVYSYRPFSNKLEKVVDNSGSLDGFRDGQNPDVGKPDYDYDADGNMKFDWNKGISNIDYNHLHLPVRINFQVAQGQKNIEYLYNAVGTKLSKRAVHRDNTSVYLDDTTLYLDGFQYVNDVLQFFPTSEGYVSVVGSNYNYVFNYTDHLGNVRLSYTKPSSGPITILEENHYYPFGMKHSYNSSIREWSGSVQTGDLQAVLMQVERSKYQYKYNGKEYQDELSLNWYDYGARNYDPVIGRWINIDPKAESYLSYSPYNYVLNNPNYFVDPNGEEIYLHYFLRNNHHGGKRDAKADEMFMQAAITRGIDFINSSESGSGDVLIMKGIDSMDKIKTNVEADIAEFSGTYGKTAEFGLWSHGGTDGPFRENANKSSDQMSVSDWGKINFNWSDNATAGFYGCRTARPETAEDGKSFVASLSGQKNMKNVDVSGQTHRSWPSPFTNVRQPTDNISQGNHIYPTYMVGSHKSFLNTPSLPGLNQSINTLLGSPTYAQPMAVYKNGTLIRFEHQSGKKK